MPGPFAQPPFGITHPLGLPRPVDTENFFGARLRYFAENLMPIPTGCLTYFDVEVYRPYVQTLVALLKRTDFGWTGPAFAEDPPRYCLLRDGIPARIPSDVWPELPDPPKVSLEQVLAYFDRTHNWTPSMQLLDVLTLVSEDLGTEYFTLATASHRWVAEFMR